MSKNCEEAIETVHYLTNTGNDDINWPTNHEEFNESIINIIRKSVMTAARLYTTRLNHQRGYVAGQRVLPIKTHDIQTVKAVR